jgi:hypothetical protein
MSKSAALVPTMKSAAPASMWWQKEQARRWDIPSVVSG